MGTKLAGFCSLVHKNKHTTNDSHSGKAGDAGDKGSSGKAQTQKRPRSRLVKWTLIMVALAIVVALVVSLAVVETSASPTITSDSYFYGQSPPVYPPPKGTGTGAWASAYAKAATLVGGMTLEEKNSLTAGTLNSRYGCSGAIPAIERLKFPGLCLNDAENGVRGPDFVNAYPAGLHLGASWNKELSRRRAIQMGLEFRRKGVNVALGPVVAPLGRVVTGGRNWEGFANDPYLAGQLAAEFVTGMQGVGITTSTKHFIGYEQEFWRQPHQSSEHASASVSSNIDDKTMHELYLWPFQDALRAGSGCVMCSYQRINNSYGCQNSKTLNGLLKQELGFQGFVVSDWGAQHAGYAGAESGLDMAMPDTFHWGKKLLAAVNNGSFSEHRLTDMATRIVAAWYQMGQDNSDDFATPGHGIPAVLSSPHKVVDAKSPFSKPVLLQGAIEGHVLVKNTDDILPLKKPKLLSLFGYDARALANLELYGILNAPPETAQYANFNLWVGGGSGGNSPAYISDPYSAFTQRAYDDDTSVLWDFEGQDPDVDRASDACIVFINAYASEGYDRPGIQDEYSDKLVENVAKHCNNTIVVLHNAGLRTVGAWIDNKNVKAVIFGHLPGQDSGRALVQLMYGAQSFSGKLPYTVAKRPQDYGHLLYHSVPKGKYIYFPQSDFIEGVYTDYRYFDQKKIEPRFEFGFGLTYTTFEFSNVTLATNSTTSSSKYPPDAPIEQGGNPRLFDTVATVTCVVKNTGSYDAMEVAQLYLGIPGAPKKQLRGFEKIALARGESTQVTFELTRRDLSVWDTHAQQWLLQSGKYMVYVGDSSQSLPLRRTLSIQR